MWIEGNFFKYSIGTILVLVISLLLYYSLPIFQLIVLVLATISLPILFSVLLYYLLSPLIMRLERWMPKYVAILLVYLVIGLVLTLFGIFIIPEMAGVMALISPNNLDFLKDYITKILTTINEYIPLNITSYEQLLNTNFPKLNEFIYGLLVELISAITSFSIAIAITPFVLYYFLRDDYLFTNYVLRFTPDKHQDEVSKILHDVNVTLTGFISTQVNIAIIIGCLLTVGYLFIGLPYAILLALLGMIFYVIPFLGTFLAIIPALLIAATIHFTMMIKVVVIMFVAHFIEAYLITPKMMSTTLKIHPLTIILLLLIGGSLFGILGLILITPAYSILKVLVWNIYKITRIRYKIAKMQEAKEEASESAKSKKEK